MAAAISRVQVPVSQGFIPTPTQNPSQVPPTPNSQNPSPLPTLLHFPQKFSIPASMKEAKDFIPANLKNEVNPQAHYGAAVIFAAGLLCLGFGLYYYLNSQGIRPDAPQRIAQIPLIDLMP